MKVENQPLSAEHSIVAVGEESFDVHTALKRVGNEQELKTKNQQKNSNMQALQCKFLSYLVTIKVVNRIYKKILKK